MERLFRYAQWAGVVVFFFGLNVAFNWVEVGVGHWWNGIALMVLGYLMLWTGDWLERDRRRP